MPREEFTREVEKELTGRDTEPSALIYFKVYKSQLTLLDLTIVRHFRYTLNRGGYHLLLFQVP
jgi:hypothetical protein